MIETGGAIPAHIEEEIRRVREMEGEYTPAVSLLARALEHLYGPGQRPEVETRQALLTVEDDKSWSCECGMTGIGIGTTCPNLNAH